MVSSAVLFVTVNFGKAQTGTSVSGIITSDTTWTQANSPYTFTGNVLIYKGVTLTIQPAVQVYLDNYYLEVNGTLNARGSTSFKIQFISVGNLQWMNIPHSGTIDFGSGSSSWNEQTNSGCIIENAIISSNQEFPTVNTENSSPKINNCTIINTGYQRSIWINDGTPVISNNTITSTFAGITFGNNMLVSATNASVSDNTIFDCEVGIEVYHNSPIIERNLIINNTGNKINGAGGIRIDSGTSPLIRNNTIIGNSVGLNLLGSPSPRIMLNNIQNNFEYGIYLYSGSTSNINASYNWWGISDTQSISQSIYDFKNDFNLGTVTFTPFLTSPNIQAPTYINASAGAGGSTSPSGIIKLNYGDSQTFTITPDTGYHVNDVLVNGTSVSAISSYMVQNVYGATTISATFAPNTTPTPSPSPPPSTHPTPSPSPIPTPNLTPNPTPTTAPSLKSTQISISADASSTVVGASVNINGKLTDTAGTPLASKTITLSYTLAGSNNNIPIGSDTTTSAGEYSLQWVNTASGTFSLNVEWNGDASYAPASNTTTLSFLPYQSQNVFLVESNSTVTALVFNSTSSEFSFSVSGPTGTTGYVKTTIAKNITANPENIKVYLDGNQLNYVIASNSGSWELTFNYHHSTHSVTITFKAGSSIPEFPSLPILMVLVGLISLSTIAISKRNKGFSRYSLD